MTPSRRSLAVALLGALACTTTPPPPPATTAAAPAPATVQAAAPEPAPVDTERLSTAPPPARRRRQFVVSEAEYLKLRKAYPRGFQPEDCTAYCRQDSARTSSDDGLWTWTLRCLLDRNMRDEPIVSCREEARAAKSPSDDGPSRASTYTVIDE